MQREYEQRNERTPANQKACHASDVLRGDQIVKEHYIGSRTTMRGTYANKCQYCNAIRFPKEKGTICYQKGKVMLPAMPEPSPILISLLEGQDQRSKMFRKHIIPLNNALALASINIKHKNAPH